MTAKEMFEKLGYTLNTIIGTNKSADDNITYFKTTGVSQTHLITFIESSKTVSARKRNYPYQKDLSLDEVKAMHKQMKELGWIE